MPFFSRLLPPACPRQNKNIIRGLKLRDAEAYPCPTSNSEQSTVSEGSTSNSDQSTVSEGSISSTVSAGSTSNSNQSTLSKEEEETLKGFVRFGPTYKNEAEVNKNAKDSAWNHILQKSGGDEAESLYMAAIKKIEKEAMESYEGSIVDQLKRAPHEFRLMMARDGCFFLQLALHILGGGEHLGYSQQHPYLGANVDSSSWMPAMFFPGNQIPYVVIKALMKQRFFQDVIMNGTWPPRPTEDLKLVLYETVLEPHLPVKPLEFCEPSTDILDSLHKLLLGSGGDGDPFYFEMREFQDLEAGREDGDIKIPSAGELYKQGIKLTEGKKGITNIRFRNLGYSAFLYVPPLTVDTHTKHLLTSLVHHEQNLNCSDRELTAYLRFLRDLAPSYKDFKILENKGIIRVQDENLKSTTVQMLDQIVSSHKSNFTLNFRHVRYMIKDYGGPPWRLISIVIGVLTLIQTIFTILSFFIPHK